MRYFLALLATVLAVSAAPAQEVAYPHLMLQTPFTVEKVLGKPDQVVDGPGGVVQWRYLAGKRYDPRADAVTGKLYLSCSYLSGRLIALEAFPKDSSQLNPSPGRYVPSDVTFKVKAYDGAADLARTTMDFQNGYLKGQVVADCPPLKGEKLAPSGLYTVQWDYGKLWQGQVLSVKLSVLGTYVDKLRDGDTVPPEVIKAVSELPLKG